MTIDNSIKKKWEEWVPLKKSLDDIDAFEKRVKRSICLFFARKRRKFYLDWAEKQRDIILNPHKYFEGFK